jgi:hypothetical protein
MSFFRLIDKGKGPVRLFVGGVHGKEGLSTIHVLKKIQSSDVENGKLIIYNCNESKYISTLNKRYYHTPMGKEILRLIKLYKPEMYVEPHCYRPQSYHNLTDAHRKDIVGVPPLIELEKGVLIGSVSPFLRTKLFKREDVCLTLEMPCIHKEDGCLDLEDPCLYPDQSMEIYLRILKLIAKSNNRDQIEDKVRQKYPEQVKTAIKYAQEFFGEYPPF